MTKVRIGILGTSEIAFRRFLPALKQCQAFEYIGVASRILERTQSFVDSFGGRGYGSYEELLADEQIDAVYIPLPPALHYEWGKKALEAGKHVFMEKPFTTNLADTRALLELAEQKGLAVHENYMFLYHSQFSYIKDIVQSGQLGKLRQLDFMFSFPRRSTEDFRYSKELGGGALLDCGGYTVRGALELLGHDISVESATLCYEGEIDLYGSVTLKDENGTIANLVFGMDNSYRCDVNINGQVGNLYTDRIFTAPHDYTPRIITSISNTKSERVLEKDDQFINSIQYFHQCMTDECLLKSTRDRILKQGSIISEIIDK